MLYLCDMSFAQNGQIRSASLVLALGWFQFVLLLNFFPRALGSVFNLQYGKGGGRIRGFTRIRISLMSSSVLGVLFPSCRTRGSRKELRLELELDLLFTCDIHSWLHDVLVSAQLNGVALSRQIDWKTSF